MKQLYLIFAILALSTFVRSACTDPLAQGAGCFCKAGYYGDSTDHSGTCTQCPSGTNSVDATAATTITACTTCLDTNANNNGANPPACFCKPGYYGVGQTSGSCTQCPSGTTYSTQATATNTVAACTACLDTNASNNGASPPACFCKPGYYGVGQTSGSCTQCPSGTTYSTQATATNTVAACTACLDTNANNNGASPPACFCKPGYYGAGQAASSCTKCPNGSTYTTQATASNTIAACTSCFDSTKATNNNSSTAPACSCTDANAQYSSDASPVCQCKANFYGTASTTATSGCTACPSGQTSAAGSTTNVCQASTTSSHILIPLLSLLLSLLAIF